MALSPWAGQGPERFTQGTGRNPTDPVACRRAPWGWLMRLLVALVLVGHGLVHAIYVGHARRLYQVEPDATWPDGSWALARVWGEPRSTGSDGRRTPVPPDRRRAASARGQLGGWAVVAGDERRTGRHGAGWRISR